MTVTDPKARKARKKPATKKAKAPTRPRGRPTAYTPQRAEKILARLAEGMGLKTLCREDPTLPTATTVRNWVIENRNGFSSRYAHARSLGLEVLAEEIIEIADDGTNDRIKRESDGEEVTNQEHIQRSRLRVDTRKWLLSKLKPHQYGDAVQLRHADAEGGQLASEFVSDIMQRIDGQGRGLPNRNVGEK